MAAELHSKRSGNRGNGMSTHEIREDRSKLAYMGRLKFLPQESYARRMYYHIRYQGSKTGWMKRIKTIDSKYGGGTTRHLVTTEQEWARTIRAVVTRAGIEDWRRTMQRILSLQLYRKHKKEPAPYPH